jgi:hypothetical protein
LTLVEASGSILDKTSNIFLVINNVKLFITHRGSVPLCDLEKNTEIFGCCEIITYISPSEKIGCTSEKLK